MGALDLAPQILNIVAALVANPDRAVSDSLRQIAGAAAGDVARIAAEAQRLVDEATTRAQAALTAAEGLRDDAEQQLAATIASFDERLAAARQAATDAAAAGAQAVDSARRQADQVRAGAVAAAGDAAEIAQAETRAQQLIADAEAAAAAATQRAEQAVADVTAEAARVRAALDAELARLRSAADAAVAALGAVPDVQAETARLSAAAQQAVGAVTALPGKAVAMAEDARRQVAGLLEPSVSLVGLITQALTWLKNECFADEPAIQVVAYDDPAHPAAGVGLSWVQGDVRALVAYVPDLGGPKGGLVVETATPGGGAIALATGSPVRLGVSATGSMSATLSFDAVQAPAGDGSITVSVGFDTSSIAVHERFLQAGMGTPNVHLTLSSKGGAWHYRAVAQLDGAHWRVDFASLLDPIPNLLPVDGLGETRTFGAVLEDGVFSFTEAVSAA